MRPRHIVLFILSCLVLLGGLCVVAEFAKPVLGPLRWPTITDILPEMPKETENTPIKKPPLIIDVLQDDPAERQGLFLNDTTTLIAEVEEVVKEEEVKTVRVSPDTLPTVKPSAKALDAFIASLKETDKRAVRVVHYGDSQIEEDRITATIRRQLQSIYGGGGPGLLPLQQTIPTRTVRQWLTIDGERLTSKNGPKRYLVYGPKNQRRETNTYGPMGQVAVMDTLLRKGSNNIVMHIEPFGKITSANHFNRVRILKTNGIEVNARSENILTLPDNTSDCTLDFYGQGEVYGVSLETPTGVIVDNIPMRGGSGNVFTQISFQQLSQFFRETNTRLIILQFGGNVMPWADTPERVRGYAHSMRQQIRYLRSCAPEASILFVGPSDMTTVIDGQKTSYPMLPLMDEQLARIAASEGIAYWSLYKAMGGWNSMIEWYNNGLAASDGIHFTQAGANKAGNLLWKWLEKKIVESKK